MVPIAYKVAVIGLGRIGLPIALVLANAGNTVYGVDVDSSLISMLKQGKSPILEPGAEELVKNNVGERLKPLTLTDFSSDIADEVDYVMICIGIGISGNDVDVRSLFDLLDDLVKRGYLNSKVLILRTTVPLGLSDEIVKRLESVYGLTESKDYYYSYVPERLAEGVAINEEINLPKLVGVYSDVAFDLVRNLLSTYSKGRIVKVKPPIKAEFVKLLDNVWRNLIFGFANEVAILAEAVGVNAREVIRLANLDYPRNNIPMPGPVSGYCLSKDPLILEASYSRLRPIKYFTSLWVHARLINDEIFTHLAAKIVRAAEAAAHVKGRTSVAILGLSYKRDVDDFRFSHSITVLNYVLGRIDSSKVRVLVHDPFINTNRYTRLPPNIHDKVVIVSSVYSAISESDIIVLLTNHSMYYQVARRIRSLEGKYVIDAWGVFEDICRKPKCVYDGLGVAVRE